MPPLWFFIGSILGYGAQRANRSTIRASRGSRYSCARRFIHEGHELVGESRHGAADANAPDIGASADSGHPAALGHIAIHYRSPASQLHNAFRRSVNLGEIALLVVAGAIAAFVYSPAKQPRGTQLVVERNHGRQSCYLIKKV